MLCIGPNDSTLGCNHEAFWIRVQSLCDQPFADLRTIGVRGVDEVHAEFDGMPQQSARRGRIRRDHPRYQDR